MSDEWGRPMESLFSKLFHAGSSERNRREDFLTEIFADLLGRLPHSEQLSFCTEFLLPKQDDADKRAWIARAEKSDQFAWRTQARVIVVGADHPKRPDIVLYDDNGRPLMVIECKISAGFTDGTLATDGDDRRTSLDQLGWYDKWLHAASEGTAALVLLTHLVDPPADFLDPQGSYNTALRSVRRWAQVYDWLTKAGSLDRWNASDRVLAENLIDFLKESELMSESPTLSDFAAARLYLCGGSYNRTVKAMSAARQAVNAGFSNFNLSGFPQNPPRLESSLESGWLCDWCKPGDGPYISWGIFFVREDSDDWSEYEPSVSVFEGAFVEIEFSNAVERPKEGGFEHWHFPTSEHERGEIFELYKVVSLNDLKGDFTTAFCTWVAKTFNEAQQLIAAVAREET